MRFVLLLCLAAAASHARRPAPFDPDFEFADEDESKSSNSYSKEKKRWIHDPNSELCLPLNCKKKEVCLLEDAYTAVCVSKKELHRSGETVIPRSRLSPEEARRFSRPPSDPGDDDDLFYDSEDDPEDSQDILAARCSPCPVVKPTFLCGSDNRTYSSPCRLDYHNCIHHTSVKVMCKGFCPCKDVDMHLRKKQKQAERMNNFMTKYKATMMDEAKAKETNSIAEKYTFTPQDFSYDNKHYKYIKYTKHEVKPKNGVNPPYFEDKERGRGDNEVLDRKQGPKAAIAPCGPAALHAIGDRLLDWFSVIMADSKRRQQQRNPPNKSVRFPSSCKVEVRWMFHHLDTDSDAKLSLQELYDIEHDQRERCIKPFLDACDADRDIFVSSHEWCKCFEKTDRPCAAVKRRISSTMMGVYVPDCDAEGYYFHTQCHNAVGMCWCVDKHGVELPNSRTRGKPNCESLVEKRTDGNGISGQSSDADLTDDNEGDDEDDDDDDQDSEGSADRPLDF